MNDINENALTPENNEQMGPAVSPPVYYSVPAVQSPPAEPFHADKKDGIFAIFAFILGYLFCRWVLGSVQGWGTAVFTAVYLASTLVYLMYKGVRLSKESWFWFAVTLLTGLSFALWDDIGVVPLRNMFLFCSAVYWVMSATSVQMHGRTGNYLLLDGLNAVLIIPFRNFINQYRAFGAFKGSKDRVGKKVLPIVIGVIVALLVILVVTPQLIAADSGGFSNLITGVVGLFRFDMSKILEFLLYCLLAIPTAAYLFGLISGSAVRRGTATFKVENTEKTVSALRIVPPATINIILGTACVLYVVFIVCQIPYFFSAFSGTRPDGWLSYSDYARKGFFELCRLAAINLFIVAASNILSRKPRSENTVLKIFNIIVSLITLILITTALSKMALYIDAFGLTILRILPCVFMILLAVVCVTVIVMQKLKFSVVRVTLIVGAVLFTALCLFNTDGFVVKYNTDRYLSGSLEGYDTDILYRSGSAGVIYAVDVYNTTSDALLKGKIKVYLYDQKNRILFYKGTFRDNLQTKQAWEKIKDMDLGINVNGDSRY